MTEMACWRWKSRTVIDWAHNVGISFVGGGEKTGS